MRSFRPCSDSSATPSFPSQPEGKIGLPRANPRGRLILQNGLVGSPCSPRDSQESSPTPQLESINSSGCSGFFTVQLSHPYMTTPPPAAAASPAAHGALFPPAAASRSTAAAAPRFAAPAAASAAASAAVSPRQDAGGSGRGSGGGSGTEGTTSSEPVTGRPREGPRGCCLPLFCRKMDTQVGWAGPARARGV